MSDTEVDQDKEGGDADQAEQEGSFVFLLYNI